MILGHWIKELVVRFKGEIEAELWLVRFVMLVSNSVISLLQIGYATTRLLVMVLFFLLSEFVTLCFGGWEIGS